MASVTIVLPDSIYEANLRKRHSVVGDMAAQPALADRHRPVNLLFR